MGPQSGVTERDAARALLRIDDDLHRALMAPPKLADELACWAQVISTLLIEQARGRLFLQRLRQQACCEDQEALEGELAS